LGQRTLRMLHVEADASGGLTMAGAPVAASPVASCVGSKGLEPSAALLALVVLREAITSLPAPRAARR